MDKTIKIIIFDPKKHVLVDCRSRKVNTFWELLDLISKCEGKKLIDLNKFCGRDIKRLKPIIV